MFESFGHYKLDVCSVWWPMVILKRFTGQFMPCGPQQSNRLTGWQPFHYTFGPVRIYEGLCIVEAPCPYQLGLKSVNIRPYTHNTGKTGHTIIRTFWITWPTSNKLNGLFPFHFTFSARTYSMSSYPLLGRQLFRSIKIQLGLSIIGPPIISAH